MKSKVLYIILIIFGLSSCKSLKVPLSEQIGPGKTYSSITYSPLDINSSSKDFAEKWIEAEKNVYTNAGKRKLQKMTVSFSKENEFTVNFGYIPPNGKGLAAAIFTYTVKKDEKGNLGFELASKNANAKIISAGIRGITDEFFEKYQFKIDWVTDKVPGSYGTLAGMHSVEDANYWFYGTIK